MSLKVSILIPLYNSVNYISQTLESCLKQSFKNIEVIVVDDGSTDGSFELAKKFESDKVKVYKQLNTGACSARNSAFAKSTGDYIQYLDADDLLSENKILNQIKLLTHKNSAISSCSWEHFVHYPSDRLFLKEAVFKSYDNPIEFLVESWNGGGMMQTACWLMPRELAIKAGPWNEDLKSNPNDDGEYFCRVLLNAEKIIFSDDSKVFYRLPGEGNVSKNTSHLGAESLLGSYVAYEQNVLPHANTEDVKKALARNYLDFVYRFYGIYPDLSKVALQKASVISNIDNIVVGGKLMRILTKIFGFTSALHIRSILKVS